MAGAALRILDANLNRAREALRVMEEYARFALDDATLVLAVKETRHALAACTPASIEESALRRREIMGDVGRDISTPREHDRAAEAAVAVAAGKRLSEALRSIEEYGKIIEPAFAAAIQRLRYQGYELERRLRMTAAARERFGQVRLYVILTEAQCRGGWFETAEAVLHGGADVLQLREKGLVDRELLARATRLAQLCRRHDAIFIVNDRPDVAVAAGAHGVHLGQEDLCVRAARRVLPGDAVVGVSTHTLAQVEAATTDVPDYIAVGPIFASATKSQDHVAGLQTLAEARRMTSLPLTAIGGIDERNARLVRAAGATCLCVCSAIISQADPQTAAARLRASFDDERDNRDCLGGVR